MQTDFYPLQTLLLTLSGFLHRHQTDVIAYLVEENRVLKEQLKGRRLRLTDDQRRRLAAKGKRIGRLALNRVATIVTPDTIMRWHRRLIAAKWTYKIERVGRPGLMMKIKSLIVRMATDNPSWGYCRIQGELKSVGHRVASTTVAKVLKDNGIKPAPDRPSSWRSFLKAHWEAIAAADFFSVEVVTGGRLVRYMVFFVMKLKTREVLIAGISASPTGAWMRQIARNLTDAEDGFLAEMRSLILDRDPLYTMGFREMLGDCAVTCLRLPARSPNLNAFAERWVRSIREECLDRIVPLSEAHLRNAVREYVAHYNCERRRRPGISTARKPRAAIPPSPRSAFPR